MIKDITVGVTTVAFSKNDALMAQVRSIGFKKVKRNEEFKRFTQEELINYLKDCDAAIVGLDMMTDEVLEQLPKLKVISKYGVGLNNVDLDACNKRQVQVLYPKGVNKRSVSEMALGFMLSLSRNLYVTSNLLKSNTWHKSGGFQLSGKTVGIIGVGHIGKDLVHLLKPFDCKILVNDIIDQTDYYSGNNLIHVTKEELFEQSDIISVHTPLTDKTEQLIRKDTIDLMKPSVIIINTARGEIVNLKDLKSGLMDGTIGGAALDVYDAEPPTDRELISLPNLMNTPHIGGNSQEAVMAMGEAAINNVVNFFQ